jgi:hypothetical protein
MRGLFIWALFVLAFLSQSLIYADELPTALSCSSNAKAWRDYGYSEKKWGGPLPPNPDRSFGIATKAKLVDGYALRDKVISALNTAKPRIRSITPSSDGIDEQATEFEGTIVGRTDDAVFVMWTNNVNKGWLAGIDRQKQKATVSQVFQGQTSIGGEIETLDCR